MEAKKVNEKKMHLIELSQKAKDFKKQKIEEATTTPEREFWEAATLNYILIEYFYKTDGVQELKTFDQWKRAGKIIVKGSKAFAIWGQPAKATKKEPSQIEGGGSWEKDYKFWPLCCLFSNLQVKMI